MCVEHWLMVVLEVLHSLEALNVMLCSLLAHQRNLWVEVYPC